MKFFLLFMLGGALLSLYFLLTDEAGSGMGWGVGIFAGLGVAVAAYNYFKHGNIFAEKKSLNEKAGR